MGANKETYAARRAMGLCGCCGKNPAKPGTSTCKICAARKTAYAKRIVKQRRDKIRTEGTGQCLRCGAHVNNNLYCDRCRNNQRKYAKTTRARKEGRGLCDRCGAASVHVKPYCKDCYEKEQARKSTEAYKKQNSKRGSQLNLTRKLQVIAHYTKGTNKCQCPDCPTVGHEFLTIDHKNNDGNTHRKNNKGAARGAAFYAWIIKNNYPDDLQVLCWNCNMAKQQFGNGTCPHVRNTDSAPPGPQPGNT